MIINLIKKRIEEKRLTQAELTLLVGVSQVYIRSLRPMNFYF